MAGANRNDPYKAFNFLVEIDGIQVAGFTECTGLSTETDIIEYREGSERGGLRKIPGLTKFSNITLKRGLTQNRDLWKLAQGRDKRRRGPAVGGHRRVRRRSRAGSAIPISRGLAIEMGRTQVQRQVE
jgi:phage tail-like protein